MAYPTLVLVLAYCGLRRCEAVGLRVQILEALRRRLNVEQNAVESGGMSEVRMPKSHHRRSVPFPQFLYEPLAAACEGNGCGELLFRGKNGSYLRQPRARSGKELVDRSADS